MSNAHFKSFDVAELLGVTQISRVPDEYIWNHLVTPQTRALLGEILSGTVSVRETVQGEFPGDEVSNFNDHRLYGGQTGFVRFPYVCSSYRTRFGAFIVKRDAVKFVVLGWMGDVDKGTADLIFRAAMRDRRFDGTLRANDSALVDYPFDDPVLNHPLKLEKMPENFTSAELTIYCFMPGSRIVDATGEAEFDLFVEKPFRFVDRPELFLQYFSRAWNTKRAPGQNANPIYDVSGIVSGAFDKIAMEFGYDYVESTPSHYHVAKWTEKNGYLYADPLQAKAIEDLGVGIKRLKKSGMQLTRPQESWLCVVQSLPKEFIPQGYDFGGVTWPQDNISSQYLWMYKPVSDRARQLSIK